MAKGYSRGQIGLHWLIAALLVPQYIVHGEVKHAFRSLMRGGTFEPSTLIALHVWGGVAILALVLWRLALRRRRGVPGPVAGPVPEALVRAVHVGLYAVLLALPLTGLLAWYGMSGLAGDLHELLKLPLFALVGLHVLGALYHQIVLRDGLIGRMLRPG